MIRTVLISAVAATLALPAMASCRQALALGLDVSGSVDLHEYRLQVDGLITALNAPSIRRLLFAMPDAPVYVLVYEWSGPEDHTILVPWTDASHPSGLDEIGRVLAHTERRASTPGTALGQAMRQGALYLGEMEHCWKKTLDLSGDGMSNLGPQPQDVKKELARSGITINALVIGSDAPATGDRRQTDIGELSSYFRTEVILGPDAFVQTAIGFEDYAAAMTTKLEREIEGLVVGLLQ